LSRERGESETPPHNEAEDENVRPKKWESFSGSLFFVKKFLGFPVGYSFLPPASPNKQSTDPERNSHVDSKRALLSQREREGHCPSER